VTRDRSSADLELTVTDLKQWAYCERIPFYRYVVPVEHVRTYKMKRGKEIQAAVEALEHRRRLREYGIREGTRLFGVALRSTKLGLTGKLDLLLLTPSACFPVDFKDTEGGVRQNHRIQVAAYALLVEEAFGKPAPEGYVYLVPTDEVIRVPITKEDRSLVAEYARAIRQMVFSQTFPDPTSNRRRCLACEFQNYCGDIW
jgi:CRISPR-associated exonuclease Cas4